MCTLSGAIETPSFLLRKSSGSFSLSSPPPPASHASHELQYITVMSCFTRLNMKTKYVCRGLFSLYKNFHNNRTMWSAKLYVSICRWREKEKEPGLLSWSSSDLIFFVRSSWFFLFICLHSLTIFCSRTS